MDTEHDIPECFAVEDGHASDNEVDVEFEPQIHSSYVCEKKMAINYFLNSFFLFLSNERPFRMSAPFE